MARSGLSKCLLHFYDIALDRETQCLVMLDGTHNAFVASYLSTRRLEVILIFTFCLFVGTQWYVQVQR